MIVLMWHVTTGVRRYLRTYMPSNIIVHWLRTRRGLECGVVVAGVLVLVYLFAASFATQMLAAGAPGWLNVLVMIWTWNAMKFASMAALSPLTHARRTPK